MRTAKYPVCEKPKKKKEKINKTRTCLYVLHMSTWHEIENLPQSVRMCKHDRKYYVI